MKEQAASDIAHLLQFLSSLPSLQSWMSSHLCDVAKQRLESHRKPGQVLGVTTEE